MNNLGNYLKKLRLKKGASLNQVEEYTGVSASYISRLESGERKVPSVVILSQLAVYYKVLLEDILEVIGIELNTYNAIKEAKKIDTNDTVAMKNFIESIQKNF